MKNNGSKKDNGETTAADIRLLASKADDALRQAEAARERARLVKAKLKKARKAFKAAKKLAKRARKEAKAAAKDLMRAQATLLATPAKRVLEPKAAGKSQPRKPKQPTTQGTRGNQLIRSTTVAATKPGSETNPAEPPIRTGTIAAPEITPKQSQ